MEEQMPNPQNEGSQNEDKDTQDNKSIAILSYLGVLCLIPLLFKRDSKFAKFHSKQGVIIFIGWCFVWIPFLGWLLGIVLLVFSIMGILNVLGGKYEKLPIVGDLAEKINI